MAGGIPGVGKGPELLDRMYAPPPGTPGLIGGGGVCIPIGAPYGLLTAAGGRIKPMEVEGLSGGVADPGKLGKAPALAVPTADTRGGPPAKIILITNTPQCTREDMQTNSLNLLIS
mmetsp:Transcript_68395/g.164163  ORF Transcript_68395/g.164163 Transcript_68395/m.164163 type:complete len:116 (+) Transcript_68395:847-1194(+)